MVTRTHGHVAAENCSAFSARLAEPLAGTAPAARAWLLIEQPGPWGARALTESHLDPDLGAALNARAQGTGVRLGLIRRVGHHALGAGDPARPRRVLIGTTTPGRTSVRALTLTDPRALLDLDFAALGAGEAAEGDPHPDPVLLVCTNGKRDRCCALLGRSLALELADEPRSDGPEAAATPGGRLELWEADHLGGHRFAPTALVLPTGYAYGRLDAGTARAAVLAAGRGEVEPARCRGRSTWSRFGQAADLALRAEIQEYRADAVSVLGETRTGAARTDATAVRTAGSAAADRWTVDLAVGENRYQAVVERTAAAEPRPESCATFFGTPAELRVLSIDKAA